MKLTQEKAAQNFYEDPIELSNDDDMEEPTAKTADEESPHTAKGPSTPATPEKKVAFARQLYIRKERNQIDPQLQQKRRCGTNRASLALSSRFVRLNSSLMIG
jgi:hypothetical protein